MALYGDPNFKAIPKAAGSGDPVDIFQANFTTAGAGAPTVNAGTRGVISVARTGVGVFRITLPWNMRNVDIQTTIWAWPAGAIAHLATTTFTDGTKVIDITVVTIAGGVAAETTGLRLAVRVQGRGRTA